MTSAYTLTIALLVTLAAPAQVAESVKLEPNARFYFEFPDLPDTLATKATGNKQPPRLTARLPANYSRERKFPLFVFLNGGDGGRGDSLPLDRTVVGSNDFICVNLPLFKRTYDTNDGGLISVDDFDTVSRAYRVMLDKLLVTVPNTTPERSAFGGFSNGAHTTALLLAGQDELILQHFRSFYFVEGGAALAANVLHKTALKRCRFLLMRGDYVERSPRTGSHHLFTALEYLAMENKLNFTSIIMENTEHAFPRKHQTLLGQWVRGEELPVSKTTKQ
jgi:hypothetical protein